MKRTAGRRREDSPQEEPGRDALLKLVLVSDHFGLRSGLLTALDLLLPEHSATLYEIEAGPGGDEDAQPDEAVPFSPLREAEAEPLPIGSIPGLAEALTLGRRTQVALPGLGTRTLVPLTGLPGWTGALLLDGAELGSQERADLEMLLEAFRHQHRLIDRIERDALTGLLNRQALDSYRHRREPPPGVRYEPGHHSGECLTLIDLDHFKEVNDRYGHLYGDEVLILVARQLERSFRRYDQLYRYGGEEFAVILHNVTLREAVQAVDRFRECIQQQRFPRVGRLTISAGITQLPPSLALASALDRADRALYFAKGAGRNQTYSYEQLLRTGRLEEHPPEDDDIELF